MPPKVLNNNNETDLHFKMRRVAKIYNIMLCLSLSLAFVAFSVCSRVLSPTMNNKIIVPSTPIHCQPPECFSQIQIRLK